MKTYFATGLHDSEEIARMHMPNSSRPVPVYLVADIKPDARGGRCACEWSGDALKVVCFAHLTAVREFDGTARAPAAEQNTKITDCLVKQIADVRETARKMADECNKALNTYASAEQVSRVVQEGYAPPAAEPAAEREGTTSLGINERESWEERAAAERCTCGMGDASAGLHADWCSMYCKPAAEREAVIEGLRIVLDDYDDGEVTYREHIMRAIQILEAGK